jgi:hypothetical protein
VSPDAAVVTDLDHDAGSSSGDVDRGGRGPGMAGDVR